jgi:hypothetical protein
MKETLENNLQTFPMTLGRIRIFVCGRQCGNVSPDEGIVLQNPMPFAARLKEYGRVLPY